jgi:uncharacterized protein YndB with AHSA1/START domain
MTETDTGTIRRQIVVDAPIDRAFAVFTERFGDFKPPEHNLLAAPIAETVFEPVVGGNIVDRAADGSECRWARILAYDPPDRVVFSWDISPGGRWRPIPSRPARSRSGSSPRPRSAPVWNSSTETSTATAPAGRPSARGWRATVDGRCT